MVEDKTLLFQVEDRAAGTRLDLLIPQLVPDLSRSRVQKMIGTGQVTINDRPVPKRYLARPRDLLRVIITRPEPMVHRAEAIPLAILYEDDDLVAIAKPSGLVVHPAPGHSSGTLVNALLHHLPALPRTGEAFRPGIVHRLDKDTSGIVLVAKTDLAHRRLASQFARRRVQKTYLAVAAGRFRRDEGGWDLALGRDRKNRKKISPRTNSPKTALTRYRVIRHLSGAALLEIQPETGRTHQIRVHLAEAGHPILGDPLYGPAPRRGSPYHQTGAAYGFDQRLALHAWKISCLHPVTREPLDLHASPPEVFERLLAS